MDTQKKKISSILIWCVFMMYAVATFTKINYSAAIAHIVKEGIFSKTDSGIIGAAFYLVYGAGQIFGTKPVDKYSPYSVTAAGFFGSLLCNIALCFSSSYIWVLTVWSLNGLALSVVWPGAVRMVAECVLDEHRRRATNILTSSIAVGGIASYVTVPFILEAFGWSGMFVLNSLITALFLGVWLILKAKTEKLLYVKKEPEAAVMKAGIPDNFAKTVLTSGIGIICLIVLVRAVMDNGLKTWIPTMMMESYNMSTVWSNILTAIIYICNILGVLVIMPLISKLRNEVKMMAVLFTLCLPLAFALIFIGSIPQTAAILSLILITSLTYVMTSVQVMFSSRFAAKGVGHSGAVAAMLNGFASFGVLIASGVFGYLAENFSWQTVSVFCVILTVTAVVLAVPAMIQWEKFNK